MKASRIPVNSLCIPAEYLSSPEVAYSNLCQASHTLLLESAETSCKTKLKSIILQRAAARITCNGNIVEVEALTRNGKPVIDFLRELSVPSASIQASPDRVCYTFTKPDRAIDEDSRLLGENPFSILRIFTDQQENSSSPYSIFLAGIFAYDMIAVIEELPAVHEGENTCPDYVFYLAETLIVTDHKSRTTTLIENRFGNSAEDTNHAHDHLNKLKQKIETINIVSPPKTANKKAENKIDVDMDDATFIANIERLKSHIIQGDIFQAVPSRTFIVGCADPMQAYIALKKQNPSPYMFFMRETDFVLFGASPESALKFCSNSRNVEVYPIAGTRRRGKGSNDEILPDLDSRIELEMRNDEKELAEHLMLVDLARNDIARISVPGSRHVPELLKVDRYSHVMHLVSRVQGTLRPELDALHAYQACMNMGTLVGAPKLMAASLVRKLEGKRRGTSGGAIGYLNGNGDMDTCIIIRSAFVRNGIAQVQAGAGIVFDSIPKSEADETRSKAQAVINAILSTSGH